jgi:hypothetical protein
MKYFLKRRWLKGLRSGKFLQGTRYLSQPSKDPAGLPVSKLCCLGVLCEVLSKKDQKRLRIHHVDNGYIRIFSEHHVHGFETTREAPDGKLYQTSTGMLSEEILQFVGLTKEGAKHLATLNDGGASFSKIADVIEKDF